MDSAIGGNTFEAGGAAGAGCVVHYHAPEGRRLAVHRSATVANLAARLAGVLGCVAEGRYDPAATYGGRPYFVPSGTLVGLAAAGRLGIASAADLFGGVVPHAFVADKSITHPLVRTDADAPEGWSAAFAERVRDSVLFGFTAFGLADARRAAALVGRRGAIRVKPAGADGGRGQQVAARPADVDDLLEALPQEEMGRCGVVLEEDLEEPRTYSIGRLSVGGTLAAYCGTQHLTKDNSGGTAYGGSQLFLVRGDFHELLGTPLSWQVRQAVRQAQVYDDAAIACYAGMFASRRNYDVIQGRDAAGRRRSGVLEQSWRIGGASGAEIVALEAFAADRGVRAVRASCREVYGAHPAVPADAVVYYQGYDPEVGPLTKYARIEALHHAA